MVRLDRLMLQVGSRNDGITEVGPAAQAVLQHLASTFYVACHLKKDCMKMELFRCIKPDGSRTIHKLPGCDKLPQCPTQMRLCNQ